MLVMDIPFIYGRVVEDENFINRTEEIKKLSQNFRSGLNTIIVSPRRWGKSSLVKKVVGNIPRTQIRTCQLDLFNIRTEKEFYESYAREVLKCSSTKWQDWIENGKEFLKGIIPQFSIGADPIHDFNISFDFKERNKSKIEIINLPEKIAQKKKIKIVVCIDEFQNISFYNDPLGFQKQLRAGWQHHTQTSYCLYGSKRHMITEMFENKSMPFYKFGDLMFLKKIETNHWLAYIADSFKQTKKTITHEAIHQIVKTAQNHPYFVQQLARKVWNTTGKKADESTVSLAIDDLLHENSILYLREIENLSNTQINFLQAISENIKQLSSAQTLKTYKLGTSANVQRIKASLEQKEIIDFMETAPEFIDPFFQLWLMRIYFKK